MNGLINYVSCGALWLGLAVKTPDLVRHRRDPYLRAICVVLALAGACFFLGAAPTVGTVNRLSGVPNLAAPLTYASITAYSAASQVLVVHWRGGERVRRVTRRWMTAYACVAVGIAAMFVLGRAPVERRTDLDTYYATTPFIAEMIVLYLAAHLAAVSVTTVSALRWAREVRGWLRAGLVLLGLGSLCSAGYGVTKSVAVAARWSGRDWSALSTDVSPAAAGLGALVTSVGILVPLTGPRLAQWWRSWRAYARLAPLERELDDLLTRRALRLPRPRWCSPTTRLIWRQTSIHNALSYLDAFFDRALYERVRTRTLAATGDPEQAEAAAWAAVITGALRQHGGCPAREAGTGAGASDARGGLTAPEAGAGHAALETAVRGVLRDGTRTEEAAGPPLRVLDGVGPVTGPEGGGGRWPVLLDGVGRPQPAPDAERLAPDAERLTPAAERVTPGAERLASDAGEAVRTAPSAAVPAGPATPAADGAPNGRPGGRVPGPALLVRIADTLGAARRPAHGPRPSEAV
ncbi:MAB_1171c family putative transporter [Streptomyces sp. NRRL S-340]|uniref:MAB_1171c family putative transporter n=1 Tax=Streptomyces sp. NRRL S-340 TaxID=1463901 RepID=UPI00055F8C8E|nr:MAB_1171c family putative transporter [Streptomyces sp. NRRL S-340]